MSTVSPRRWTLITREGYFGVRVKPEDECSYAGEILTRVIEEEWVLDYLDDAITKWRTKREEAEAQAEADDANLIPRSEEDLLIARCYVDAFQSVRSSVFGETLPA